MAEALVEMIPCAESVRFLRTGGEAMSACMKLARAYTGRDRVLMCGYHGWLTTMGSPGVPEAVRSVHTPLPWGDPQPWEDALKADGDHVAALTVAYSYTAGEGAGEFLQQLRELADRYSALLIFDEIVTGFRLSNGGAQGRFSVTPDLATFSKGMANGWPVAAYLGRRDVMETVRTAVVSSTFGGEATALAAARACLAVYRTEDVIGHLDRRGRQLIDGLNERFAKAGAPARVVGLPPCPQLLWEDSPAVNAGELALRFEAEWLKRRVITYGVMYVNYSHTAADIDEILARAGAALEAMRGEGLFG
ncbi:MAG: aminotransferase class III-fold pyridoxal phosphate-dependent enzyme [Armatimonadetes bacterium]|nr:aminotransferase class III-fold pyridoxal phosphate-dependent enzyme [Armatimonadota bacterium]